MNADLTLNTPLVELHHHGLPRVGQKTAHGLAVEIAAIAAKPDARDATVEDLLHYLPMRYEDRSNLTRISQLQDGQTASVEAMVRVGGRSEEHTSESSHQLISYA